MTLAKKEASINERFDQWLEILGEKKNNIHLDDEIKIKCAIYKTDSEDNVWVIELFHYFIRLQIAVLIDIYFVL